MSASTFPSRDTRKPNENVYLDTSIFSLQMLPVDFALETSFDVLPQKLLFVVAVCFLSDIRSQSCLIAELQQIDMIFARIAFGLPLSLFPFAIGCNIQLLDFSGRIISISPVTHML